MTGLLLLFGTVVLGQDPIPVPDPTAPPPAVAEDFWFDENPGYRRIHDNGKTYVIRAGMFAQGDPKADYEISIVVGDTKGNAFFVPTLTGQQVWRFDNPQCILWNEFWYDVPLNSQLETDIILNRWVKLYAYMHRIEVGGDPVAVRRVLIGQKTWWQCVDPIW